MPMIPTCQESKVCVEKVHNVIIIFEYRRCIPSNDIKCVLEKQSRQFSRYALFTCCAVPVDPEAKAATCSSWNSKDRHRAVRAIDWPDQRKPVLLGLFHTGWWNSRGLGRSVFLDDCTTGRGSHATVHVCTRYSCSWTELML